MERDPLHPDLAGDTEPRVYTSRPDTPGAGRTFVWSRTEWFERIESDTENGAVAFSPVAATDQELRQWLRAEGVELDELDPNDSAFAANVRGEFMEQAPLYPEAPELSDQPR